MKAIFEKLCDESVRIECMVLLAGAMAAGDSFPDELNDFFDDNDEDDIEACLGAIPDYVDLTESNYERTETISEWLITTGKLGFLVQFATPVMEVTGPNSRSFSWGHYSTKWIYAVTIDEAIQKGMEWAKQRRDAEDSKAKDEKGGAA